MISWTSVWAIVLRHIRLQRRDLNYVLASFYWPLLDIIIWGFLGSWIQQSQTTQFHNYEITALLGILLWQVVGRGSQIMLITLSEELWSQNIVNLFSLPLKTIDWIVSVILFYTIMMFSVSFFCMAFISMIYDISMHQLFFTFLIFFPPLFFSAIWIGFSCLQIIIALGKRSVELGFIFAWFLLPLSGAYYPLEVLPRWAQSISSFLPMSYVFKGLRGYLMHQQDPTYYLIKGYALSIPYALCAIILFIYCFNRSKRKGLARLAD